MEPTPIKYEKQSPSLVGAEPLLKIIFPDASSRPSLRWLREMQAKRLVPYLKIGRKVYFDPKEVRPSFDSQFKVESLG